MRCVHFLSLALSALSVIASPTTPTRTRRHNDGFVTIQDGEFVLNGKPFKFVGTTAYWLAALNTEQDINKTLHDIAATGVKVVRTWAFNDVTAIPENGTWFQLIANGTTQINDGPTGLQRLDKVVEFAEKAGLKILFSLTNNWNPTKEENSTQAALIAKRDGTPPVELPRNFLSNDYGGIDAYVREFGHKKQHDEFFANETIINVFKNYTTQIVKRYKHNPTVFAWELANDARCNSSVPASTNCNTLSVTDWHADVSGHIRSVDPNHLVSAGVHGFQCMEATCPKRFPLAPPPAPSPAPGRRKKRRAIVRALTKDRLQRLYSEQRKKTREARKRQLVAVGAGVKIRGRWVAALTARQTDTSLGTAFDGSQGVDSQDILNGPGIDFGSFQLFPDQNSYGPSDPNLDAFDDVLQQGLNWIDTQARASLAVGKPTILTGFGLVSQNNTPFFVPFDSATPPSNSSSGIAAPARAPGDPIGVSTAQQVSAYSQWLSAASSIGVSGAIQYQWGQTGLTPSPGSTVSPNTDSSGTTATSDTSGVSPNDGYSSAPTGSDGVQDVLRAQAASFGSF